MAYVNDIVQIKQKLLQLTALVNELIASVQELEIRFQCARLSVNENAGTQTEVMSESQQTLTDSRSTKGTQTEKYVTRDQEHREEDSTNHNSNKNDSFPLKPSRDSHHVRREHKLYCLRKCLQRNVVTLVENIPFNEAELYDLLISSECLTETECDDLQRFNGRKDQVRKLVQIIRKKSYRDIHAFLMCLERLIPHTAAELKKDYLTLLSENPKPQCFKCSFCKFKESTDMKQLADHLWSRDFISEELYKNVTDQKINWEKLFEEFEKSPMSTELARFIRYFLSDRGQVLAKEFKSFSSFKCTCETNCLIFPQRRGSASEDFNGTTASPGSSCADGRGLTSLEIPDDIPRNKLENQFLSACDNNEWFCPRRCLRDLRIRSNSFGKKTLAYSRTEWLEKRRSSSFV